jgi:glyoxylase-like metal-dependent hydrolase (beta-lactamase superfamily II)
LIDPGDEAPRIIRLVQTSGLTPEAIWLTHAHLDHIGAVAEIVNMWHLPVFLHPDDLTLYHRAKQQAAFYGLPFTEPPDPDRLLADGDELALGKHKFTVRHTPGHSPGHVVFLGERTMLGGDLLFAGSIGRTDLPFSSPEAMDASLSLVATFDHEIAVYPGHGPPTSIGAELATNPYLVNVHPVQ